MAKVFATHSPAILRAFSIPHNWKVTLGIVFVAQICSAMGMSMIFPFFAALY